MELLILTDQDVAQCVTMPCAIDLMAEAFSALSSGAAQVPVRTRLDVEGGSTLVMPARVPAGETSALGAKIVSVFPDNVRRGAPAIHAVVLLVDGETGAPAALVNGTHLTALRTGAASGLATRLLAREDARVLTVFGAGVQARTQIEAVRAVREISEVRVVSRSGRSATELAAELSGVTARALSDVHAALRGADIVVAATDSSEPVFRGDWIEPGTHVNGVGSYTPSMQEVDAAFVSRAYVVVDAREAAMEEAGDLIQPIRSGRIAPDHLKAEIGEIVAGEQPGRASPEQVTFFKSVGVAVQDVVVGGYVLERAREMGLGRAVEL